ncbi:hypothetical protein CCHR01_00720, partial [Colletotrichum chrysophilum]
CSFSLDPAPAPIYTQPSEDESIFSQSSTEPSLYMALLVAQAPPSTQYSDVEQRFSAEALTLGIPFDLSHSIESYTVPIVERQWQQEQSLRSVLCKLCSHEIDVDSATESILSMMRDTQHSEETQETKMKSEDDKQFQYSGSWSKRAKRDSGYLSQAGFLQIFGDNSRQSNETKPSEYGSDYEAEISSEAGNVGMEEQGNHDEATAISTSISGSQEAQSITNAPLSKAAVESLPGHSAFGLETVSLDYRFCGEWVTNIANDLGSTNGDEEDLDGTSRSLSSLDTQSFSGSSTSSGTDSSEFGITAAIMSRYDADCGLARLTSLFGRFIDLRLGVRQQAGDRTSPSGQSLRKAQNSNEGSRATARHTVGHGNKRSRQVNPDDGDDSGEDPVDNPRMKRPKFETTDKPKIACPFMKNSPTEYSTWRTCVGPGFDGMHRTKRHFKEHTCQRCGDQFKSNKSLQDHMRLPTPCILRDTPFEKGYMTSPQWDEITHKRSRCSVEERWKEIYLILFPDTLADAIPSPYFETSEVTNNFAAIFDPAEYDVYLTRNLPSRVLSRLQEELAVFSEKIKKQLAAIVQEESSETLKAYVLQKSGGKSEKSDEPINPSQEPVAFDNNFFAGINFDDGGHFNCNFPFGEDLWGIGKGTGRDPADSGYGSLG